MQKGVFDLKWSFTVKVSEMTVLLCRLNSLIRLSPKRVHYPTLVNCNAKFNSAPNGPNVPKKSDSSKRQLNFGAVSKKRVYVDQNETKNARGWVYSLKDLLDAT